MMRGARMCPAGVTALSTLSLQRRCQADGGVVPPPTDGDVSKLASHIRTHDAGAAAASSAPSEGADNNNANNTQMNAIRERMDRRGGSSRNNPFTEPVKVEDPFYASQRTYRNSIGDTDPFGGQFHKDYYRDPSKGYAPQHAPRNFADGGKIDYPTPQTPLQSEMAAAARADGDHSALRYRQQAASTRSATRAMSKGDFMTHAAEKGKALQDGAATRQRVGVRPMEAFNSVMTGHTKSVYVPDQYDLAQQGRVANGARAGTNLSDAMKQRDVQKRQLELDYDLEVFRVLHGQRAQEKHEASLARRNSRRAFYGYDVDRSLATRSSRLYGQSQFDPLLPNSTMAEAQTNLRKNAIPDDAALFAKGFSRNTVQDQPLMGEQLTESVLAIKRLTNQQADAEWEAARRESLGLGRQNALSQESGPDRRKIRLHKNDERLLNAFKAADKSYSKLLTPHSTPPSVSADPTDRNDTRHGVAHLLTNKFDIDRRGDLLAKGQADPIEGATMYYGVPLPEQLDNFVRTHRNAKGERHADYFTPFPTRQDMVLHTAYRDMEGFPLIKARPEFLEWELFTRYRAHHHQRRQLALLHGLEPVPNETIHERDVRREKLDQLCEATPFDPTQMSKPKSGEMNVGVDTLRRQFGAYFIPSPTIVRSLLTDPTSSLHVIERPATILSSEDPTSTTPDAREHILSSRYMNKLAVKEGYMLRVRGPNMEIRNHMPEPNIEYLPESVTSTFSAKEFAIYQKYINKQVEEHERAWTAAKAKRRWISERNGWSKSAAASDVEVHVVDAVDSTTGASTLIPFDTYKNALAKGLVSKGCVVIDTVPFKVDASTARSVTLVTVSFDDGSTMVLEEKDYHSRPLAVEENDPNAILNYGLPNYHYNRTNYVETQDAIWEEGTYKGTEGWTAATEMDGLREGLPVLARRQVKRSDGSVLATGEAQRAEIVTFQHQPFFNPSPRHVTVRFAVDGTVESVPLSGVYIWQLTRNGPERTVPDETRKTQQTLKRYVDVSDPLAQKQQPAHFLDRYRVVSSEDPFRSVKQITDIDLWNINDEGRSDNIRPLTISGRTNYVQGRYMPYYTPWDWIVAQEMDTPLIAEQIRTTGAGYSFVFGPNRYWRTKRRGHGYVQNSPNEVRDLFRYIDQITPWKKAQKIRNLWEVRQHHPFPKFHRPEVAMHRNNPGLLPSHMWDLDKKTGRVKSLKESVASYQTLEPYPKWVQL